MATNPFILISTFANTVFTDTSQGNVCLLPSCINCDTTSACCSAFSCFMQVLAAWKQGLGVHERGENVHFVWRHMVTDSWDWEVGIKAFLKCCL